MLPFFEKQESVKLAVAFKKKPEAPYPRSLFFFTSSTSTLRSSPLLSIKLFSFPNPFSQTKKHTKCSLKAWMKAQSSGSNRYILYWKKLFSLLQKFEFFILCFVLFFLFFLFQIMGLFLICFFHFHFDSMAFFHLLSFGFSGIRFRSGRTPTSSISSNREDWMWPISKISSFTQIFQWWDFQVSPCIASSQVPLWPSGTTQFGHSLPRRRRWIWERSFCSGRGGY